MPHALTDRYKANEKTKRNTTASTMTMTGLRRFQPLLLLPLLAIVLQAPTPCRAGYWAADSTEEGDAEPSKFVKQSEEVSVEYGVDVSFPMHHKTASVNYPWLQHNVDSTAPTPHKYHDMAIQPLGDKQAFYEEFVDSCVKHFGKKGKRCIQTESDRIEMALRQPQSMQNYTASGFKKIKAPESIFKLIKEFWDKNKDSDKPEQWGVGNTYTNNWASPTTMVSVEDQALRGGGYRLKQKIWNMAKETIQEWTGEELTQCSLYGIRVYHEGAVLATHVDRLPLVSSAIINVAQDVDDPWPLEVIGHDGKAVNVTMEPGDMVMYESHSVLHGRPFPLKGRFMANIFIHFEPTGHSLRHTSRIEEESGGDVNAKYRESLKKGNGGHESANSGLPPYIVPGTPEEKHWRRDHPNGYDSTNTDTFTTGSTGAHVAAQKGDLDGLTSEVTKKKDIVNQKDKNGWTPLHEGARGGHLDIVRYLIENGADANATTSGTGGTALWWAKKELGADHPVVELLESLGALEAGPEL